MGVILQVRLPDQLSAQFKAVCENNNATQSETVREFIRNLIRDERRFEQTYGPAIPLAKEHIDD